MKKNILGRMAEEAENRVESNETRWQDQDLA